MIVQKLFNQCAVCENYTTFAAVLMNALITLVKNSLIIRH